MSTCYYSNIDFKRISKWCFELSLFERLFKNITEIELQIAKHMSSLVALSYIICCYISKGNCVIKLNFWSLADAFPWINFDSISRYGLSLETSPRLFLIFLLFALIDIPNMYLGLICSTSVLIPNRTRYLCLKYLQYLR